MKILPLLFCLLFFAIISCQKKKEVVQNAPLHFVQRSNAVAVKFPTVRKITDFSADSLTLAIYKANHYMSFWHDSLRCRLVIQALKDSRFDGLTPKDYGIPALERMFDKYLTVGKKIDDTLSQQIAYWKLELSITQNYLHYLKNLRFGKANPEIIFRDWDYKREYLLPYTAKEFSVIMKSNFYTLISEFRPQYPIYKVLSSVLYMLDSAKQNKSATWDVIPYVGRDLILGDTSWVISKIKQRLLSVEISHEHSATHQGTFSNLFDGELLRMLNYFQPHVGLKRNGRINKATVVKLNFTLEKIEDATRVNMERCRWLLKGELPNYYVLVNIANYTLQIYKNNQQVFKAKVIVGKPDKKTPIFHSQIATIEFNPYWTVPTSIAGAELLPKLKANPNYLSRNNMELIKGGSAVQIVDFSAYSRRYFPVVIRQKPGENNALGKVKFLFPNPYSVYLHDTPSKSLFERDERAFSHGCIRVHKPMDFAAFLLSEQGVSPEDIAAIVGTGRNTAIALKTKIPIIITYWTCSIDEKNHVFFFKDIYGRDKAILKALNL